METLNTLAKTFADQVKNQLAQGLDESGNSPSINLFTYNQSSDAAATIAVTGIAPDQIAAASVGAPGGGGNAVALFADGHRSTGERTDIHPVFCRSRHAGGSGCRPRYARSEHVIKIC